MPGRAAIRLNGLKQKHAWRQWEMVEGWYAQSRASENEKGKTSGHHRP